MLLKEEWALLVLGQHQSRVWVQLNESYEERQAFVHIDSKQRKKQFKQRSIGNGKNIKIKVGRSVSKAYWSNSSIIFIGLRQIFQRSIKSRKQGDSSLGCPVCFSNVFNVKFILLLSKFELNISFSHLLLVFRELNQFIMIMINKQSRILYKNVDLTTHKANNICYSAIHILTSYQRPQRTHIYQQSYDSQINQS